MLLFIEISAKMDSQSIYKKGMLIQQIFSVKLMLAALELKLKTTHIGLTDMMLGN